jgi:hypothetical protein
VIEARARELQDPNLTEHERAELHADIAHLQEQIAIHERTYAEMDLEPGRGFVAAEGRPVRELPALDAEHAAWTEQMRSFVRGEGPPPPPWTGPEPHLDSQGSWRGFDVREAHAAYKAAIAEGGGAYEAGIFRDRLTGEYTVLLGRRGSVAPPGELPGRSWETVAHFHPNQEGSVRFTLPAQQDVWLAMLASVQHEQGARPHIEFVDSVLDGRPTRVAIIADSTGMRMELGVGVLGRDAPSAMPIRDPGEGYYRWWGSHDAGGPAPRVARDEGTTWVPPGSLE